MMLMGGASTVAVTILPSRANLISWYPSYAIILSSWLTPYSRSSERFKARRGRATYSPLLLGNATKERFANAEPVPGSLTRTCPEARSHVDFVRVAHFAQDDTLVAKIQRLERILRIEAQGDAAELFGYAVDVAVDVQGHRLEIAVAALKVRTLA